MRIGMILDYTFPPDPRVENEAVSLTKAGHDVFLFCLNYTDEKKREIINGINICRYNCTIIDYKLSALAYTIPSYRIRMKPRIKSFILENKIESLHIHDIRIADSVFKANKEFNLPTVLDLHDNMPEVMKLYPHLQKFPGKYIISPEKWKIKEEEFIQKATKVITVSNEFIEEVVARTNIDSEKIILVPNTIRESFYKEAIIDQSILERYKDKKVVLYLGDTHVRRGLQTAISAVKELSTEIPEIKLVIVGKNSTDNILKQQVADLDIPEFVDFEGWQNVSLFPSYIEASTVCISPLHRNIQHDVAYANKIFQYMSFAKPLLVSNAIAQKRLIERVGSGLVHEDRNIVNFKNKLIYLFNDTELSKSMGEKGKEFIENEFTWEQTSKNLVHLYDNLTL